jgi:RimJ/RimL family protein N-acetyltransferase
MKPPQTFDTGIVTLRMPTLDDAESIFRSFACDSEVTRYLSWRHHHSVEQTDEFLIGCLARWEDDTEYTWAIVPGGRNTCIGLIALRVRDCRADLGYVLAREFWGRGYMTAAARAVAEWALSQPAIHRVWAVCDIENTASARVMEKIGMIREGILRRWMVHPALGEVPRDCYCYSKVK